MSSKLLREGDAERGFAGWINRQFDRLRNFYMRVLGVTVRQRWAVIAFCSVIGVLWAPFLMFSKSELAPNEDQGFIFGIVKAPANATLDQVTLFADEINKAFRSAPEVSNTFQISSPTGGFGGLVTVPWNERERTTEQIAAELFPKTGSIAGLQVIPDHPSASSWWQQFSDRAGHRLHCRAARASRCGQQACRKGLRERSLHVCGHRPEV